MKHKILFILQCLPGLFVAFIFAATSLQASTMPPYERLEPVAASVNAPTAVALDWYEHLYVIEASQNRLLLYNSGGEHLRTLTGLQQPISVAVDGQRRIFVGNKATGNVEVYDQMFTFLFKLGRGDGEFIQPGGIVITSAGTVYVADSGADTINVYDAEGAFLFSFGSSGQADGQFHFPGAMALDELSEELFIADLCVESSWMGIYEGARIQVFDLEGNFKRRFGTYGATDGKFIKPLGVKVDETGRIYVSDAYLNVVHVFDHTGVFLGPIYDQDHPIRTPLGIELGPYSKRLFVASLRTKKVEVFQIADLLPGPIPTPGPDPGTSIPEPGTLLLVGSGILGLLALRRSRRKSGESGRC